MAIGTAPIATTQFDGSPTPGGSTGRRKVTDMPRWHRGNAHVPPEEIEDERARHAARGLERWLKKYRHDRGIPEEGIMPAVQFHECSEGCILHDHMK